MGSETVTTTKPVPEGEEKKKKKRVQQDPKKTSIHLAYCADSSPVGTFAPDNHKAVGQIHTHCHPVIQRKTQQNKFTKKMRGRMGFGTPIK